MLAEAGGALDLRAAQLSRPGPAFRTVRPVAVNIAVPVQLSMDCPSRAAKSSGDLSHRQAHLDHARQAAPLFKREVVVSRSHSDPGYTGCRTWFENLGAIELTPTVVSYHAASGQAGMDMLKRVKPDVILLGVMMPDMDGPETLRCIRASGFASVPVIFLTARARRNNIEALEALGFAGVILKPFDPLTSVKQIQETLARMRSNLH